MGAQASEELATWASVSDLTLITRRMRVIPSFPAECQVRVLGCLWNSLRWVPAGDVLVQPGEACDRLFIVVRGEAELLLGSSDYIPLLPAGTYVCEGALLGQELEGRRGEAPLPAAALPPKRGNAHDPLWPLRRWQKIPVGALSIVRAFLSKNVDGPHFRGKVRTTRRSLIGYLTRGQLVSILQAEDPAVLQSFLNLEASTNALFNVAALGVEAHMLGAQDVAALRVVCETSSVNVACRRLAAPTSWRFRGPLAACTDVEHRD